MKRIMNPPVDSIFRWSCFDKNHPFVNETKDVVGTEYKTPTEASKKVKFEDGQIAWDTGHQGFPGHPVQKKIFGLYGHFKKKWTLTADLWDMDRKDLVGCVTILDWEWDNYSDADFVDENIMERLHEELDEFA